MDEIEIRQCVQWFKDVVNLLEEGKPIPIEFLKKQVTKWENMTAPKPQQGKTAKDLVRWDWI